MAIFVYRWVEPGSRCPKIPDYLEWHSAIHEPLGRMNIGTYAYRGDDVNARLCNESTERSAQGAMVVFNGRIGDRDDKKHSTISALGRASRR